MNTAVVRIDERRERLQAAAAGQRVDMYTLIHKGIRAFMGGTLEAAGRADPLDREEVAQTLDRVRSLAAFLRAHLHHENQFIHPALEARRPGSARRTANDHVGHERAIESLETAALAVEKAGDAARPGALLALYRELALFVAENLEHMHVEETENNAQLWAAYSDQELAPIHGALMGSIKPDIMQLGLRWMVPSMNPAERAGLLSHLPAEWLPGFRPYLGERDWAKLSAALGPIPPA